MRFKPQHFHLAAAVVFLITGVLVFLLGPKPVAGFFVMGAVIALIHWKASKVGLVDL
ncbi:hypothetical protein H8F21_14065 [Pseudomonas sp. P66]|uniref:Uncharacterized protein n=1 Tax=Pseudomonas arcuscaelestis TaxID=2710591 RepID=A0ABS2BZ23_9PSED|nr:hypothetical protein [Pseudomonas arcuscaelestis]MBM5458690.1 hypothetical protein [Pseudomonas arcuscaelestis]